MLLNELRVGNIVMVFPKPGETVLLRIQEIHKETVVGEFYKSPGFYMRVSYKDLSPLEFSDEWLIKAGFVKDENAWSLKKGNIICTLKPEIALVVVQRDEKVVKLNGAQIDYLHQLQNLFFVLAGTDLSIAYTG